MRAGSCAGTHIVGTFRAELTGWSGRIRLAITVRTLSDGLDPYFLLLPLALPILPGPVDVEKVLKKAGWRLVPISSSLHHSSLPLVLIRP